MWKKKKDFRVHILLDLAIFWLIFLFAFSVTLQRWRKPLKQERRSKGEPEEVRMMDTKSIYSSV